MIRFTVWAGSYLRLGVLFDMLTWLVSVKGSTEYTLVKATTKEEALNLGAARLGVLVQGLDCDVTTKFQEIPEGT